MFPYFLALIPFLGVIACVFDSDNEGVASFLENEGLPQNYKVETLDINGLKPVSATSYLETSPYSANYQALLGTSFDLNHDLFMDFAFRDENFFTGFTSDDSARGQLEFYLLNDFYNSTSLTFKDSLPIKKSITLSYSWKLNTGSQNKYVDSIGTITDSSWYNEIDSWDEETLDTTYSIEIDNYDSLVVLPIPSALVKVMQKVSDACRLQLKISAKQSSSLIRINGSLSGAPPILRLKGQSNTYTGVSPFRMATKTDFLEESNKQLLVLHGGGLRESLIIELPKEKILTALSEFYGDDFPYIEGDSVDVRQLVVLAQIKIPLVEKGNKNTLNKPIQMVVSSFVDSLGEDKRKVESYKLNTEQIPVTGHPNLVFNGLDTLALQVTYGMRDFINKASKNDNFRFLVRLFYPVLQPYDDAYTDYVNEDGDSIYFFLDHYDYVYYDLAPSLEQPMTLKLWLATKRGEE